MYIVKVPPIGKVNMWTFEAVFFFISMKLIDMGLAKKSSTLLTNRPTRTKLLVIKNSWQPVSYMYWTQTESPVRQSRLGWQGARRSSIALLSGLLDCQYLLSSSKHRGKEQQQRLTVEYCSFIYVFIHVHKWRKKNFFPSSGHKSLNIVQNVWQKSGARHCQAAPEFSWQRIYEERNPTVDETGWGGAETAKSAHFLIASPNPAVRGIFMNKKHYC